MWRVVRSAVGLVQFDDPPGAGIRYCPYVGLCDLVCGHWCEPGESDVGNVCLPVSAGTAHRYDLVPAVDQHVTHCLTNCSGPDNDYLHGLLLALAVSWRAGQMR